MRVLQRVIFFGKTRLSTSMLMCRLSQVASAAPRKQSQSVKCCNITSLHRRLVWKT